jgi:hypothetical protein
MDMWRAVATWRSRASLQANVKKTSTKIVSRWKNHAVATAFQRWSQAVGEKASMKRTAVKALGKFLNRLTNKALARWCSTTRFLHQKCVCALDALFYPSFPFSRDSLFLKQKDWLPCWTLTPLFGIGCRWVEFGKQRIRSRVILKKACAILRLKGQSSAFSSWKYTTRQNATIKRASARIISRWTMMAVAPSFDVWRCTWQKAARDRSLVRKIVTRWTKQILDKGMRTWREHADLLIRTRYIIGRVITRIKQRDLAMAFETWHARTCEMKRQTAVCYKIIKR